MCFMFSTEGTEDEDKAWDITKVFWFAPIYVVVFYFSRTWICENILPIMNDYMMYVSQGYVSIEPFVNYLQEAFR